METNGIRKKQGRGMLGHWRKPGCKDFAAPEGDTQMGAAKPGSAAYTEVREIVWFLENVLGVTLRVEELGLINVDSGDVVYPKRPRLVFDGLPATVFTAGDWSLVHRHEALILNLLEERDLGDPEGPDAA